LGDPGLREALNGLTRDSGLMWKIAWARQYYLGETTMIEMLQSAGLLETEELNSRSQAVSS
jgi:hypothetical protein